VFGVLVIVRGVGIGIVGRAAVAAGDHHFLLGFFLDVVKEVEKGRIDMLFSIFQWETVVLHPPAVDDESWLPISLLCDRGMLRAPFTSKKFFGDLDLIADVCLFPGVIFSDKMGRLFDREVDFIVGAVDVLPCSVHFAQFFPLGVFETGTTYEEEEN